MLGRLTHALRVRLLLPFFVPFLLIQVIGDLLTAPLRNPPAILRILVGMAVVTIVALSIIAWL